MQSKNFLLARGPTERRIISSEVFHFASNKVSFLLAPGPTDKITSDRPLMSRYLWTDRKEEVEEEGEEEQERRRDGNDDLSFSVG